VVTLHERHSRLLTHDRPAKPQRRSQQLYDVFARLPAPLRQTITFNKGTEHLAARDPFASSRCI
jgi:IS30 family transposase